MDKLYSTTTPPQQCYCHNLAVFIMSGSYNSAMSWNHNLYAQRLHKLIYLYLFTACFMQISLQSSELSNNWRDIFKKEVVNIGRWINVWNLISRSFHYPHCLECTKLNDQILQWWKYETNLCPCLLYCILHCEVWNKLKLYIQNPTTKLSFKYESLLVKKEFAHFIQSHLHHVHNLCV